MVNKFFLEDNADGSYAAGEIVDRVDGHYVVRFDGPGGRPAPLVVIGLSELAERNSNNERRYHLFENREQLDAHLRSVDGEADILKLVRSSSST